ncbi:MAG: ABC transporter permease [Deltaproteobacteria bacterium]|nr:ABC transporter permease [Deltaproteobacteria bacterium]
MRMLLKLAWRNIWRQPRRTLITIAAMAIGVAFSMAAIALSDGLFEQGFDTVVTRSLGHVQIHAPAFPQERALYDTIDDADSLLAQVAALPLTAAAAQRLFGYVLLAASDQAAGALLTGVAPGREQALTRVAERVLRGRFLDPQPGSQIVLGEGLAETLQVDVGGEVVAVAQAADGALASELLRVVGVVRTGSVATDRAGAFVHLAGLRSMLGLERQAHEIALLARELDQIPALAEGCRTALAGRGLLVRDWRQVQPAVAQLLNLQSVTVWIVLFTVFSVAALGILNTSLMSVFERTQELGVLLALGLGPRRTVALVLLESCCLAALAALAGGALGLLLDWYLVRRGIDLGFITQGWSWMGALFEPVLHGSLQAYGALATIGGLFAVTLLASLWPAWRAARLQPVVAMRQE